METSQIVVSIITGILMVAGLVGAALPFIPGAALIFLGALIYAVSTSFADITIGVLVAMGIVALLATLLGYFASAIGAKTFGGTRWGALGAILGVIVGIIVGGPFGLVIFPFMFAVLAELVAGSNENKSLKAGLGSVIGTLGGAIMQFVMAFIMILIFVIALF